MSHTCQHGPCPSRRSVLAVTGAVGAATLAACSGTDGGSGEATTSGGAGGEGGVIATVADIPVGGAIAATTAAGDAILITQPTDGDIHAFSSVCTHQGCTVEPADGELDCPCHGSVFDLTTGEPLHGPASDPLPEVAVTVAENGDISG